MTLQLGKGRDTFMFQNNPECQKETMYNKMKNEWNLLPLHIRQQSNLTKFKSMLKTHFFKEAFDNTN